MNKVMLIGRLTKDPELRSTTGGIPVASFSIAVNRNYKNKEGIVEADFFNVTVWRKQAENVSKYCFKGSQVCVEGRLQNRTYEAQDGTKRYITDVIADNIEFLGKPASSNVSNDTNVIDSQSVPDQDVVSQKKETEIIDEDPFKDFGSEVVLTDDDLPF